MRGNHVAIRQLVDDFSRYLYLPRLQTADVLLNTIHAGLALLTWEQDAFASAESYDESADRYRGLHSGAHINVTRDDAGLLVRPEIGRRQIDRETAAAIPVRPDSGDVTSPAPEPTPTAHPSGPSHPPKPRRYHGTVTLDPARVGRDGGRIADEVVTHLVGLVGSNVRVTLEIEAEIPAGAPDNVVRTVTENSRTLKFSANSGFRD